MGEARGFWQMGNARAHFCLCVRGDFSGPFRMVWCGLAFSKCALAGNRWSPKAHEAPACRHSKAAASECDLPLQFLTATRLNVRIRMRGRETG